MIPTRKLGDGPEISAIGLGTWALGGPWKFGWGPQDNRESENSIRQSLEYGVNWIDTAPVYGLGLAEELVGKAIAPVRKNIFISTKCGLTWNNEKKLKFDMSPENIRNECEASLKRLKTDYIDFYQIHWPDSKTMVEESWAEMKKLQDSGKVRFIGLSNFDLKRIKRCEKIAHVTFLQMPYNLLERSVETEIFPWLNIGLQTPKQVPQQTGLLAYSPLQSGLLSGKFNRQNINDLSDDDWRKKDKRFNEPFFSKALQLVEELRPIAQAYNKSLPALAISWVLTQANVTAAIVGVRNTGQVQMFEKESFEKIDPAGIKKIEEICDSFSIL